jgi:hypothetical protein
MRLLLEKLWLRKRPGSSFTDEEWRSTLRGKTRASVLVVQYVGSPLSAALVGILAIGAAADFLPLPFALLAGGAIAAGMGISALVAVAAFLSPLGTGEAHLYGSSSQTPRPPSV